MVQLSLSHGARQSQVCSATREEIWDHLQPGVLKNHMWFKSVLEA